MRKFFARAAMALTLAATALASVLSAAPAFAASGSANLTLNPTSTQVAVGGTVDVPVNIAVSGTGAYATADQFGMTFDPNVLTLTGVTDGTFFSTYANANGCSASVAAPWYPVASPGNSKVGAEALLGCPAGPAGTGTLAIFHFTANAGVNALTNLNLTPVSPSGTVISNITTVTVNALQLTVGTPPTPQLNVTGATTAAVSGNPQQFTVSYAVKNSGTAASDNSTHSLTVTVVNTSVTPAVTLSTDTFTLPLAAGASTATQTDGPFTLGGTLESITITADSAGTAGGPASATTGYQYSALSSTGNTTVNATLAATINLTAPAAVTTWVLTAGKTNVMPDGSLVVKSNVDYQVTAADATAGNNGKLTQWNGTAFLSPLVQLINALQVQDDAPFSKVTLSNTPQVYVSGTAAAQDPNNGASFGTSFYQVVGFNDKPVKAPNSYYEIVTFAASGSF